MTTIDATNQSMGRLASKLAVVLRGKTNPAYKPNEMPTEKVTVTNVSKMKITGKKLEQKVYYHYSGYPGGMKARTLRTVMEARPERALWMAVHRMLARNRLRDRIMKNLIIKK